MTTIRKPAVAGLFYPDDPVALKSQIQRFLSQAKAQLIDKPKALIAPHAGYIYSGPIAANAYAQLNKTAERISRVILLAPAHRMGFRGLAVSAAEQFETPLGVIEVDTAAVQQILALRQVQHIEQAFTNEHSIEVHLPFLQETLKAFKIVPILVGDVSATEVDEVLEMLWGGDETLIVISSDLSHYQNYATAKIMDAEASKAIESLHPEDLSYNHACGRNPIKGLLLAAQHHHLKATTIDLRNSGDTAGSKDQVVGYGAYVFA